MTSDQLAWPGALFAQLKAAEIAHIVYVPDAGHAALIELAHADEEITAAVLTTEEEGIGYLAGAWLGGDRGALLMQSSGVGNCINTLSLAETCRFPILMLITMRGEWAEFNPWQVPMGSATETVLKTMGTLVFRANNPAEIEPAVAGAIDMAFNGDRHVGVLLGQRLVGRKDSSK